MLVSKCGRRRSNRLHRPPSVSIPGQDLALIERSPHSAIDRPERQYYHKYMESATQIRTPIAGAGSPSHAPAITVSLLCSTYVPFSPIHVPFKFQKCAANALVFPTTQLRSGTKWNIMEHRNRNNDRLSYGTASLGRPGPNSRRAIVGPLCTTAATLSHRFSPASRWPLLNRHWPHRGKVRLRFSYELAVLADIREPHPGRSLRLASPSLTRAPMPLQYVFEDASFPPAI